MTGLPLADLPPARQADVLAALAAVETADSPVAGRGFRALQDPALRATLSSCLAEAGRVLVTVGDGYLSGYDDRVAERLVQQGIGVLPADDRAVLVLVLLHCVAIPRAQGRLSGASWTEAEPVTMGELKKSQIADYRVEDAVRRLRDAGILRYGPQRSILPGPQLTRLTPAASDRLWEDLVLVAAPDGVTAEVIRRRRTSRGVLRGPERVPTTGAKS